MSLPLVDTAFVPGDCVHVLKRSRAGVGYGYKRIKILEEGVFIDGSDVVTLEEHLFGIVISTVAVPFPQHRGTIWLLVLSSVGLLWHSDRVDGLKWVF